MKLNKENSINVFNKDILQKASYLYTKDELLSASIANKRQTDEISILINKYFHKKIRIIDIGCGDGKYTIELYKSVNPKFILGIDPAEKAILVAKKRVKDKYRSRITFRVDNVYNINLLLRKGQFDLAIMRGVLHHLYQPEMAIKKISNIFPYVIVLEPNGYNFILKIIERVSSYHRNHEEKSYWPFVLNQWFKKQGYQVLEQKFFGSVPYFCPDNIAKFLKSVEGFLEKGACLNKFYCGTNLIFYKKSLS